MIRLAAKVSDRALRALVPHVTAGACCSPDCYYKTVNGNCYRYCYDCYCHLYSQFSHSGACIV